MILPYKNKTPKIGENVFIAPTATLIGDIEIEDGASIWYGTVLRADNAPIRIGKNTNIQDNCTVHNDPGYPAIIGSNVTIGHNAVIHGCTIEDTCLVGINAVVLNGAVIQTGSIVAAGAVVKEGQPVGPFHLVAGAPAVHKKNLPPTASDQIERSVGNYLRLAGEHLALTVAG